MDFELSDEQQLIRETARDFTDNEIIERARENDRNEHFDLELVQKIAEQGYLGAIVPREYGGAGLDYLTYGLIVEEVGRGDSAMRTVVSVQTSLVCSGILKWGTEEQKHHYLPKLCSGEWLGCFDASVKYAKERQQFGRPIASFQLVQEMLTDIAVKTDAARMLVWRAGYLKDQGKPNTTETSIAKLYATESAIECANTAIQVHGGSGY